MLQFYKVIPLRFKGIKAKYEWNKTLNKYVGLQIGFKRVRIKYKLEKQKDDKKTLIEFI